MLVPGGQKEMRFCGGQGRDPDRHVLYSRHKGFVRLALQNGVPLVPVYSFGENEILHNIYLPTIQAWTYKWLKLALPMYPHGRWYSPIPNRVGVTVVFGEPIPLPTIANPTQDDIDRYHKLYFTHLEKLFEETKVEAGWPNARLELV